MKKCGKKSIRPLVVGTRFSEAERDIIASAAEWHEEPLGAFVRRAAVEAARSAIATRSDAAPSILRT